MTQEPGGRFVPTVLAMLLGLGAGAGGFWYYVTYMAPAPAVIARPVAVTAARPVAERRKEESTRAAPVPDIVEPSAEELYEKFVAMKARRLQGVSINTPAGATWTVGPFDYELIDKGSRPECRISFPLSLKSKAILERVREEEAGDIQKQRRLDRSRSDQYVVTGIKNHTDTWSGSATARYALEGSNWNLVSFEWRYEDLFGAALTMKEWSGEPEIYNAVK